MSSYKGLPKFYIELFLILKLFYIKTPREAFTEYHSRNKTSDTSYTSKSGACSRHLVEQHHLCAFVPQHLDFYLSAFVLLPMLLIRNMISLFRISFSYLSAMLNCAYSIGRIVKSGSISDVVFELFCIL